MPLPRYIHRVNNKDGRGWMVLFRREKVWKYFGDYTYGSWRSSARAAILYRNRIMPVRTERRGKHTGNRGGGGVKHKRYIQYAPSVNSSTGVTGVSPRWKNGQLMGYVASICREKGKQINKRFSIKMLGEDEAFRLAVEWRQEQVRNLFSKEVQCPPDISPEGITTTAPLRGGFVFR